MLKDNNLMCGYESFKDLFKSAFGTEHLHANMIMASLGAVITFITSYIYDDPQAIFVLIGMIAFDSITGIMKAFKNGTFSSAKLPRILVIMLVYTGLLSLGWNLAKFDELFSWVPGTLYFGFITTLVISIIENLHQLNIISDNMYKFMKKKMALVQEFFFGKNLKNNP
jgi:hypothetical protein